MKLWCCIVFLSVWFISACGSGGSNSEASDTQSSGNQSEEPQQPGGTNQNTDNQQTSELPNILIVIADDQGKDASAQYDLSFDLPATPNLDELANTGVVFENAWATPMCAPTRAAMLTGLYGFANGVTSVPGDLNVNSRTIQSHLKAQSSTADYQTGFFGKWHLGRDLDQPNNMGIDYFAGVINGNIDDYFNWTLTINGESETSTEYQTSKLVDLAVNWLDTTDKSKPWFIWLAFAAPHSPFHLPPADLHDRNLTGNDIADNRREYYLASIEAMDTEVGRLLTSMSAEEKDNTFILYIGDNGTPKSVIDTNAYRKPHSKGTLYEGGVNVPMFISGYGVMRSGDRDNTLINSTDIFATISDLVGIEQDMTEDHSESFFPLFSEQGSDASRQWLYTEIESSEINGRAIRNDKYKLHVYQDGSELLFDLTESDLEINNLLESENFIGSEAEQNYKALKDELAELTQ